jgi:DNA end-binding protein Ku
VLMVTFPMAARPVFSRTFLLIPNNSEKPYALLRKVLEQTGLAAIGKVTMSTKERVVLIHYYQNAIVATTLRYKDEVIDPAHFAEIRILPEAGDEELALMTKIVDKMTTDLDLSVFHDGYKERIEALIKVKRKEKSRRRYHIGRLILYNFF